MGWYYDLAFAAQAQKQDGFRWWAQRLGRAFHMHNETRIDHFRGFAGYWAVPSTAETAIDGKWRKGPGKELFDALTAVRARFHLRPHLGVTSASTLFLYHCNDSRQLVIVRLTPAQLRKALLLTAPYVCIRTATHPPTPTHRS